MIRCHNCLSKLELGGINPDDYICWNSQCDTICRFIFDEGIIYQVFAIPKDNDWLCLKSTKSKNLSQLSLITKSNDIIPIIETSFIVADIHDLPNEVPKIINKLLKLKAFA